MDSKPFISYAGDEGLFTSLQFGISQQLPFEPMEWRRSFGRAAKTVHVEANFVKFGEDVIAKESDWKLIDQTFFHTFWTDCVDVDAYKAGVKDDISNWLTQLRNHKVHDWLIVTVETIDSRKGNKAKLLPRASVLDKIKNDFCSRQPDRCLSLLDPLKSDARGAESLQSLLLRIRQLVLHAYNRSLSRFEDHMRSQREKRNEIGWSFCKYFLLQEELAFVFEMLGIFDESLVQYDELDALFSQFVLNSNVGDTPEWLSNFSRTCESWLGLTFGERETSPRRRQLIGSGGASLLDLRNYLFTRQCRLLLLLNRPWEVAQRTIPFLHNCINELQILAVSLPPGAISCWVYLSCLEVLRTCEKYNDSSHVEAYSLHTAGLWSYTRYKLEEIGVLCGLMPGTVETSEQLQIVVTLLSGMAEEEVQEVQQPPPPLALLREALSSKEGFRRHYLEHSELAISTLKHIGRFRSARLIGKDLAQFYMKLGEPQKAAAFLNDLLKTCVQENWSLLATKTQLELIACYQAINDKDKLIKVCAQIAASSCTPDDVRKQHFQKMLDLARQRSKDAPLLMRAASIFHVDSARVESSSEVIIGGSEITVILDVFSNLNEPLECSAVRVAVQCGKPKESEDATASSAPFKAEDAKGSKGGRWVHASAVTWPTDATSSLPLTDLVRLDEHFDYKQDQSLTSVSLTCSNLQTALRRRDSSMRKESAEVAREDFSRSLGLINRKMVPGLQTLVFSCKVGKPGRYALKQVSIQSHNVDFLIPRLQPPVAFNVVYEEPRIFLQRAGKGDLVAGAQQELILTVHTGSNVVEADTAIRLRASNGLLLKVADDPAFMQSVECPLPLVGPFQAVVVRIQVLADVRLQKDSSALERKVSILNPWSQEKQEALLVFVLPFLALHKVHTTGNRKYIQIVMQGLQQEAFELSEHNLQVVNCKEVGVVPLSPPTQRLVIRKDQNASYLWECISNLHNSPSLQFEFTMNYRHKSEVVGAGLPSPSEVIPNTFQHQFELKDYKTLYSIQSKVDPIGSEFCRVGSICHMNVSISCAGAASTLASLMYEVLADQMMWAVCGRTAGVVVMGDDGKHSVTLDVMPLTRGFLPLPVVRLSKYIPVEQKIGAKDSPKKAENVPPPMGSHYPRLEPFVQGQVFNWTKATQVHVLPALGASAAAADGSAG